MNVAVVVGVAIYVVVVGLCGVVFVVDFKFIKKPIGILTPW